jgi:hypothetical protein
VLAIVIELDVSFFGKSKSLIEMLLPLRLPSKTGTSVALEFSASTSDERTVFKANARKSNKFFLKKTFLSNYFLTQ